MLDDALWDANNVHIPAATLHHAVPGTRPSFSGREAHAVPVRAGRAGGIVVNLLSTCCQPVVNLLYIGTAWVYPL